VGVGGWIGTGVEEPGGNSNGGSGGKVEAVVEGEPAKRLPPPTTVPGSAEWVGISISAATAARPAAAMTRMISLALRILPSGCPAAQLRRAGRTTGSAEWAVTVLSWPAEEGYLNRSTGSSCICSTPRLGCFIGIGP